MTTSDTAPKSGTSLRRGAELEVSFTDLLASGQAVGRIDGMVVFCFGPLPLERARVRVGEVKQRYAVADLIDVVDASPARAQPFCPVFGTCGGCQLQHLNYSGQLAWKRNVVRNALQRIGGFAEARVAETIGMDDARAYRNKMSLVVDHRQATPALGFYRQRSHEVVAIDACPIVTPKLNADLEYLAKRRSAGPVRAMLGDARHLVSRSAGNQSVLTITTERRSESALRAAPVLLAEMPGLAGVTNSFDLSSANAIVGRRHNVLAGEGEIEETIAGLRYRVSAGSFFQVNAEMLAKIFAHIEPWLAPARAIVDLYCGAGTFSLLFAKHGWKVYGVEENAQAVAEGSANARRNGLDRLVRFHAGRVEQLAATPALRNALQEADVVFLDPPRKGCDEATLAAIAGARASELWYLSCDPATLARDSKFLVAKGYRLGSAQPFDMFPQTGHVETLARLEYL
ncbi:MAG TPA: 23S rRNA (uracil(1939)-C(5))-methyltransferase RlmD [Candidatus Babeliales bacterium]|nr:23S rRNA (uracil(1939)-C(5))-methyltransferase RlmD [Candidatus Babeliales bacterium]